MLLEHAEREMDLMGLTDDGDMNGMMRKHILLMVKEFTNEGHSGSSASYAIHLLEKLLKFEPITPLTGEDWEWVEVSNQSGRKPIGQNVRCGRVFKDENGAYDIEGRVFWKWRTLENGEKYKSFYTSRDSHVYITFPYVPETVYIEVNDDEQESNLH